MSDNPNTEEAQAAIKAAVMRFQSGDLPGAVDLADQMVRDHPDHPVAHNVRGVFLMQAGSMEDALEAFAIAVKLRPDYAEAHNNCGVALGELMRHDLAIEHYRRAIALGEDYAEAHNNLGTSLDMLGKGAPALERFQRAAEILPSYVEARHNHANLLRELGRDEEARAAYHALLETNPDDVMALVLLAMLHRFETREDPLLARMVALQDRPGLELGAKARLQYGIARALHEIGEIDAAFALWQSAAGLRKAINAYDPDQIEREVAGLIDAFPAAPVSTRATADSATPLFILGMPRSGTTLVEQMLAGHSDIAAAGELGFMEILIRRSGCEARRPSASEESAIRDNYLERMPQFAEGRRFVTDKTPANFLWVGHILATLPEAKIIHIRRDPRAVCWSIFRNDFGEGGQAYPSELRDVVAYHNAYARLMAHWMEIAPERIITLDYQALVEDPEAQMKAVLAQLGLELQTGLLDFSTSARPVKTLSFQQVRRGIYTGSTEAWMTYEAQLREIFDALEPGSIEA